MKRRKPKGKPKPKGYVWRDGKLVSRAHARAAARFQSTYARLLPGKPGEPK